MSGSTAFKTVLFFLSTALCLGLCSVWLSIERMDLAYEIGRMETQLGQSEEHAAKLAVERDTLLSPVNMQRLAESLGLGPASTAQIRRVPGQEG